jgi:hypothetical protein
MAEASESIEEWTNTLYMLAVQRDNGGGNAGSGPADGDLIRATRQLVEASHQQIGSERRSRIGFTAIA